MFEKKFWALFSHGKKIPLNNENSMFATRIVFHIYVILLYTLHDDFMQFTAQSTGEIRKIFNL
jgi:uncharacterized membrane protein